MQSNPPTPKTSIPPPPERRPAIDEDASQARYRVESAHGTRAALVWATTVAGLVLMSLLIVFILQNQDTVHVHYFGLEGTMALGLALSIAAVGGGFLVAVIGAVRIMQLRVAAVRGQRGSPTRQRAAAPVPLLRRRHHAR